MLVIQCDRCKKDSRKSKKIIRGADHIRDLKLEYISEKDYYIRKTLDLCADCYVELCVLIRQYLEEN